MSAVSTLPQEGLLLRRGRFDIALFNITPRAALLAVPGQWTIILVAGDCRCASLGNKLKAERAEYDAYSVHHREFLADLAAILGVKTLNMTEIKDATLTLHLKYLDLEQHMQQVEQDKFLYKQEADDKVSSAQQTAAAAMTRALAAEATMAAANKRAAAAEAQVAASGRSVAAAQTVADVEVSLAKQRAAAAEAKAAEVVQEAMQDKLAAQQKAQSAESEAIAAATAHKQAAALLTAALVDMQQRQDGLQASVADLMQSSMFDRIKALLSIERSVASPERRAASPMGADRPVSPAAGVVHGGLASPCSPQERYSRTSGRCL